MKTILAAGGLVLNPKGEFLFIFRRRKWDLPKGKADKGEALEKAAIREVMEECGVKKIKIVRPLIRTFHTYELDRVPVLKETHWFLMKSSDEEKLIPQEDEDITRAIWAKEEEVARLLENSFDTIKKVMEEFFHSRIK